jgi:hypothetical protein
LNTGTTIEIEVVFIVITFSNNSPGPRVALEMCQTLFIKPFSFPMDKFPNRTEEQLLSPWFEGITQDSAPNSYNNSPVPPFICRYQKAIGCHWSWATP